jgi:hypothetical protein
MGGARAMRGTGGAASQQEEQTQKNEGSQQHRRRTLGGSHGGRNREYVHSGFSKRPVFRLEIRSQRPRFRDSAAKRTNCAGSGAHSDSAAF